MRDKICVILNLPRVGGTLFSRIMSCSKEIKLFSEIHPIRNGMDIKMQLGNDLSRELANLRYVEIVKYLAHKNTIVLRDHTHLDFTSIDNPSYELTTINALKDFNVKIIALTRHPADQYLSCMSRIGMKKYLTLDHFAKGYVKYHQRIAGFVTIKYEDLIATPEAEVKKACDEFEIKYTPEMVKQFHKVHTVSGDRDQPSRAYSNTDIVQLPPREGRERIVEYFRNFDDLVSLSESLGYKL